MDKNTIGWAVDKMKAGDKVRRSDWTRLGIWIALHTTDDADKMSQPYVYTKTINDGRVPWVCSQDDLLADDWETAT